MTIHIMPYSLTSDGAKTMSRLANTPMVKRKGSKFVHKEGRLLVNWGSTVCNLDVNPNKYLNHHDAVRKSVDKAKTYEILAAYGLPTCEVMSYEHAMCYLGNGGRVVCRTTMRGKDGDGLDIYDSTIMDKMPKDAHYTKFEQQHSEYRVLVFRGKVLTIHRKHCPHPIKVSKNGVEWRIKELKYFSEGFKRNCTNAVAVLGLDFGGVDIMVTNRGNVILEVNTAIELTIQQKRLLFTCFEEADREAEIK